MGQTEEDVAFVAVGPNRQKVLFRLTESPAIPAQIREDTGLEYSRISESVNALRGRDLIRLLVPEETARGRLYEITERGEDTIAYMQENGMLE
ncbi:MAG: ArsR family transcriptional regulator [Euryarchaeota archaeon]|jgi:DNA-binding MarR family transcriptional regulator|nr:ArsR family transcriptional regulator [Euryarchaeota archaeon]